MPYTTYDELQRAGWVINPKTGIVRSGYASVGLCLYIDGRRHVCVSGAGVTYDAAFLHAMAEANTWMARQPRSHPARANLPDIDELER